MAMGIALWQRTLCGLLLLFSVFLSHLFPVAPGQNLIAKVWTIEEGLPQNSVLCLIKSHDNYIWLGTPSGLVRFDGHRFLVFNRWNTPALENDYVVTLFQDRQDKIWIGTDDGGLICLQIHDGEAPRFTVQKGIRGNTIRAITEDSQGGLWIGTDYGLSRILNGEVTHFTMEDGLSGLSITALAAGTDGQLWIGTRSGGLNLFKEGHFSTIPFDGEYPVHPGAITALYENDSGILWAGSENGLFRVESPGHQSLLLSYLPHSAIKCLLETEGQLWIGTAGDGLYRLVHQNLESVQTDRELPDYFVNALLEDSEGNLWLGSYTSGLIRLKTADVGTIATTDKVPGNIIHAVLGDDHGRLWLATDRNGLWVYDEEQQKILQTMTAASGLTGNRVRALWLEKDNTMWAGTTTGLNHITGNQIETFTTEQGLSNNTITSLYRDSKGHFWVGTVKGLNRKAAKGNRFERYGQSSGDHTHYIRTLAENNRGELLVGTRSGLFLADPEKPVLSIPGNNETNPNPFTVDILALWVDSQGIVWAGANGSGLLRVDLSSGFHVTVITSSHGLPDNHILSITADRHDNLWMSSYNGVFRIQRNQLLSMAKAIDSGHLKDTLPLTAVVFDEQEGMTSGQCVFTGQPSAWMAEKGLLYIPTIKGVSVFNTTGPLGNTQLPLARIESLKVDNRILYPGKQNRVTVPSGSKMLAFQFSAPTFTAPDKTRFLYRLEGVDEAWRERNPQTAQEAVYPVPKPGEYRFTVLTSGNTGEWNPSGVHLNVRVVSPFYKQVLFYVLLVMGLGLLGVGYAWYRRRKKSSPEPDTAPTGDKETTVEVKEKYKTSALLQETVDSVLPELNRLMQEEKIYLKPDINLKRLAQLLNIHYNHLSRIINEQFEQSFNDYINRYRIQEARQRLTDPANAKKTILEIAYDTGFYSKSVFNTAFKKFTGMTPSQFRKNNFSS